MNAPEIPPIEITTDDDGHDDHQYGVWASITRPDNVDITARVGIPCDATPGDLAQSLVQVCHGVAAAFGNGLPDQVGMRIVDPDAPPPAGPHAHGAPFTVAMCDQILEQARENGVDPEQVRIQVNGRTLNMMDVRHLLTALGLH